MLKKIASTGLLLGCLTSGSLAQTPQSLVINPAAARDTISRHIYGQFMEHLGRGIYEGLWQKDASGNYQFRQQVVDALKNLNIPNVRWPGGCFADYYFWKDGIGPRTQRPTIVNNMWGGVTEDNSFGTHEYFQLIELLGTEPMVVGNVGSGSVHEMAQWWEYINHPGKSPMADLRRQNGREQPWNVRYWGVGNESWGCGGNMTPEYYADEYKRFATYLQNYGDVRPIRIATGPSDSNYVWTEGVMRDAGRMIDVLDMHYYTVTGDWGRWGSGTQFAEREWITSFRKALRIDTIIARHSAIMDKYDPRKRVALMIGEWGMWHDMEPGSTPGFLYQQNTLRDALIASVQFDIFHRHADRVRMANIAQMVNVLQAMVLTEGPRMLLTPTYHVFDFYQVHQDALALPLTLDAGTYQFEGTTLPALSATASRDRQGRIHIALTNIDPNRARTVDIRINGVRPAGVSGRILTAAQMNAHNTFDQPNNVVPREFTGARVSGETIRVELPAKSIVALELR
jgi:alpha-N-arabinofuranosidase